MTCMDKPFIRLYLFLLLLINPSALIGQGVVGRGEARQQSLISFGDSIRITSLIRRGLELVNDRTDSALIYFNTARKSSEALLYNDGIALALMGLSSCYAVKNDIAGATQILQKSYSYCLNSPLKSKLLVKWYRNQFIIYKYAGKVDSALATIEKIMPLLDQLKDTAYIVNTYNHTGSILIDNQDYDKARIYIFKALQLNKALNTDKLVSSLNMGYVHASRGSLDSVFYWANIAYEGSQRLNIKRYKRSASLLLVKYYLGNGDKAVADWYTRQAITLIDSYALDNRLYVYRVLSKEYFNSKDYRTALAYGNKARESLSPGRELRRDIIYLYAQLAAIHHALGNNNEAYEMLSRYNDLSDTLNLQERTKALDRVERQFRLAEKEKEIALKQNEVLQQRTGIRNRNIGIAVTLAGLLVLVVLLVVLQKNARRKLKVFQQQKEINELKAMIAGEEKERNRLAIELHDNVGALLSAAAYGLESAGSKNELSQQKQSLQKVDAIMKEIQNEIRKTAHTLMPDVLMRDGLPGAVRQYCIFIEQETGLRIDMQQQGVFTYLPQELQLLLYRIAQELLQNIHKHARAGSALVQLHSGDGIVSLTVEDNGRGMPVTPAEKGRGLLNIEQRLKAMNGTISFDSDPGKGTSVYIELSVL